nr:CHASE3 domain-containing protein [Verrucomicrobiota bacterium]
MFSQKHFQAKLLSGTAAGVLVIVVLAGIFPFVTLRDHHQEIARTHTVEILRQASLVENDLAELETAHRGYLLTGSTTDADLFSRLQSTVKGRIDKLTGLIVDNPIQRKRVSKVQDIVRRWTSTTALPEMQTRVTRNATRALPIALGQSLLEEARETLHALQNDERVVLDQRMRDREWAVQATQILELLPKLERSVMEMDKEKRGYLLTGEENFLEGYKTAMSAFLSYHGYVSILIANESRQSALLSEIKQDVVAWINGSAPEIEAQRSGRSAGPLAQADPSHDPMRSALQKIGAFQKNEVDVFEARAAADTRQRIVKTTALGILCLLAVVLLVVSNTYSTVLVRRQLAKLDGVETRIKSIIHNILDGMITVDAKGVICSMNPAAEKMFGCINNEMIGHKFTRLVPKCYTADPEASPAPCAWDDLARRTGSAALAVGQNRRQATFPIEISLSEMVVDGHLLYVAMVRDVTERKRFETEIASEKESLAVTLRSIGDGVITTDVQGKIIMINKAGETLTGWDSAEAIGQPLKTVFNVAID